MEKMIRFFNSSAFWKELSWRTKVPLYQEGRCAHGDEGSTGDRHSENRRGWFIKDTLRSFQWAAQLEAPLPSQWSWRRRYWYLKITWRGEARRGERREEWHFSIDEYTHGDFKILWHPFLQKVEPISLPLMWKDSFASSDGNVGEMRLCDFWG